MRVGLAATLAVGLIGWGLGRARFGPSDQAALSRVEAELRQRFDASAATLAAIAARVPADPETSRIAPRDQAAVKRLFDAVSAAVPADEAGTTGVTVYDAAGEPLAWAGRVSDLPKERVLGPATLLIAPGALGPRLVRIDDEFGIRSGLAHRRDPHLQPVPPVLDEARACRAPRTETAAR